MPKQNPTLTLRQHPLIALPHHGKQQLQSARTRALIRLGLRSQCCGARIVTWHRGKYYCAGCDGWLFRDKKVS